MANLDRINAELQRQISEIIRTEVKNPRVKGILTVTEVRTTADLKYAKVYISYYGNEEHKDATFEALKASAGFIRNCLKDRVKIRMLPALQIIPDETLVKALDLYKKIEEATKDLPPVDDEDL